MKESFISRIRKLIKAMLQRAQPGTASAVRGHVRRAQAIALAIGARWGDEFQSPYQWQLKHVRWYLQQGCAELAPATRYDHWRTIRVVLAVTGKLRDWEPRLRGPWFYRTGMPGSGRGGPRPKLAHCSRT